MPGIASKRHGFTLVELLVVIAIISIIAGLVVPTIIGTRGRGLALQCTNNLRQIGAFAMSYSSKHVFFPYSRSGDGRAHESFNVLLRSRHGRGLRAEPELLQCPEAVPANLETDGDGQLFVDETVSYTWTSGPVKNTAMGAFLSSDKYVEGYTDEEGEHSGHAVVLMVLKTDGSVIEMEEDDLPEDSGLPDGLTR